MKRVTSTMLAICLAATMAFGQDIDPERLRVNINATFQNDYGQPLEGVTVRLIGEDDARQYEAEVQADGSLRLEDVRPGTYFVQFELEEFVFLSADEKGKRYEVTVQPDGSLTPDLISVIKSRDVKSGMWKQLLIFFGIAAAGGAAVI